MVRFARSMMIGLILISLAFSSGCFDINTARRIFYPPDDTTLNLISGTIADVRYDFKGPIDSFGRVQVGAAEFHREIDNFNIAPGGGNLYLWVQVHFFHSTSTASSFQRYVNISLIYLPADGDPKVMIFKSYLSNNEMSVDLAESVGNVIDPEDGIWSLKVEGVGTSITSGGATYYDWFKVSANGVYSDRSFNHNAPGEADDIP